VSDPDLPSKQALKEELTRALEAQLATLEAAYEASREAATHEEAKPENDKDTRALEQSYVARGQALRIEEVRAGLADVRATPAAPFPEGRPAALGALVIVEEKERRRSLFLCPYGGGVELSTAQCRSSRQSLRSAVRCSENGRATTAKRA